jgi:segregation and condensation protein A
MFELLETRESINFTDLFTKDSSQMHVICAFLALLDAVKDKSVLVEQDSSFSDIIIRKRPADWNPNLADDYDDEYDAMEAENGVE